MNTHKPPHEQRNDDQSRIDSIKPVIREFIAIAPSIHEIRLHALCFYADVTHYEKHGERLTSAEYNGYMHGAFSHDLRHALREHIKPNATHEPDWYYGATRSKYTAPDTPADLPPSTKKHLQQCHTELSSTTTTELKDWTKTHPLYQQTDYNDPIDFTILD